MRHLSAKAQELVSQLYQLARSTSWIGRAERDNTTQLLLSELAFLGEPAALTYIAPFLVARNEATKSSARKAISSLATKLTRYELIHLSDYFVWSRQWYFADAWDKLSPYEVSFMAGDVGDPANASLLGLVSFHHNGFVRHSAVHQLTRCSDGGELPYLLIRLNDWVDPIAQDARSAVLARLNDDYVEHWVENLPLVVHLKRWSRRDQQDVISQVMVLLLDAKHDEFLKAAIGISERHASRDVVRYGLSQPGEHRGRLVSHGIASDDPVVRLLCCRHVVDAFEPGQLKSVLVYLASDKFTPVRSEALRITAERFPQSARDTWRAALLDRSRSVRALARFSLSKLGHDDVANMYRQALAVQPLNSSST